MSQSLLVWKKFLLVCIYLIIFAAFYHLFTYIIVPSVPSFERNLELCPATSPDLLGEFSPDVSRETLESVESRLPDGVEMGGYYKPKHCISRDRVAIIAVNRDRDEQIPVFVKNLHPFLIRQQVEYQIFVVYQLHGYWFNRASLFNVGFVEALKVRPWDCFIFHDIDMVPMNDYNLYTCPRINPRHMAVDIDKFNFRLLRQNLSGGVIAFTEDQFENINGFSNTFWAWGGEDNDLATRIEKAGYTVGYRYPHEVTKLMSMPHQSSYRNPAWQKSVRQSAARDYKTEGLNTLKYHVKKVEINKSFVGVHVNFDPAEMDGDADLVKESNVVSYDDHFET